MNTCSCTGSLAGIHASCLLNWQRHAAAPSTCSTCRGAVQLPPVVAAAVRLPLLWLERLQQQAQLARQHPAQAAWKLWNWGVVACGTAHAAMHAQQGWLAAPGAAHAACCAPLLQRWMLLPTGACLVDGQVRGTPSPSWELHPPEPTPPPLPFRSGMRGRLPGGLRPWLAWGSAGACCMAMAGVGALLTS